MLSNILVIFILAVYLDIKETAIDPGILPSVVASRLSLPINTIKSSVSTSGNIILLIY